MNLLSPKPQHISRDFRDEFRLSHVAHSPRNWFKGWRALVAHLDGIIAPNPGAPREWRASFIDRRAARSALERILAWPIDRVLIAHGEPTTTNGAVFVRNAFAWLLGHQRSNDVINSLG
jgi:hypothetical protein